VKKSNEGDFRKVGMFSKEDMTEVTFLNEMAFSVISVLGTLSLEVTLAHW
jgi:hypothetical protein